MSTMLAATHDPEYRRTRGPDHQPGQDLPAHRRHVRRPGRPRLPAAQPRLPGLLLLPPQHAHRHYKEPVMAATSSFTEGASVFGGQANLLQAITTIFTLYNPESSRCTPPASPRPSATTSPDHRQGRGKRARSPPGKLRDARQHPQLRGQPRDGLLEHDPGLRRLLRRAAPARSRRERRGHPRLGRALRHGRAEAPHSPTWGATSSCSRTRAACSTRRSPGATRCSPKAAPPLDDIRAPWATPRPPWPSGPCLQRGGQAPRHQVQGACEILDLPIGSPPPTASSIRLRRVAGVAVPESIVRERGRLVDMMADMHQYTYGKTVALAGDPGSAGAPWPSS
jgi:nitrogenase molybdenum-iron protein beta chain